jgi:tetratricopeptide (TPR) repeat protein
VSDKSRSNRRGLIRFLIVLITLLLACNLGVLFYAGVPGQLLRGIRETVSQAEGIQLLLKTIELGGVSPDDAAMELLESGAALAEEGQTNEALAAFLEAYELAPDQPVIHMALAGIYEQMGNQRKAIEHLKIGLELSPDNAMFLRQLGRLQCTQGDHEECIIALEKAVELEPDEPAAHFWLGLAYQYSAQGDFDMAQSEYVEALRLDPEIGGAHLGLGYIYQSHPGQDVLALEEFGKALAIALETGDEELAAQARKELAALYYAQDNYNRCIEEMMQVLEQYPDDADARWRLGFCYTLRRGVGDLAAGVSHLEDALKASFANLDLYYLYLGDYYASQGDEKLAVGAWQQYLRFSDDAEMKSEVKQRIEQSGR